MLNSLLYCVAIANRAWASCCAARSSNVASLTSTITRMIVPVKANGVLYRSDTGEQVSQPMSKLSFRWLSPDPYLGSMSLADPQSLNRYSYVRNAPVRLIDLLGLNDTDSRQRREPSENAGDFGSTHCGLDGIVIGCQLGNQLLQAGEVFPCFGRCGSTSKVGDHLLYLLDFWSSAVRRGRGAFSISAGADWVDMGTFTSWQQAVGRFGSTGLPERRRQTVHMVPSRHSALI